MQHARRRTLSHQSSGLPLSGLIDSSNKRRKIKFQGKDRRQAQKMLLGCLSNSPSFGQIIEFGWSIFSLPTSNYTSLGSDVATLCLAYPQRKRQSGLRQGVRSPHLLLSTFWGFFIQGWAQPPCNTSSYPEIKTLPYQCHAALLSCAVLTTYPRRIIVGVS